MLGLVATEELFGITPSRTVIAWAIPYGVACVVCVTAAIRRSGIARPNVPVLEEAIRFGFPAWLGNVSTFVNYRLDQDPDGVTDQESTRPLRGRGQRVRGAPCISPTPRRAALTPAVARGEPELISERALRAFRAVAALTIMSTIVAVTAGRS